jgi:hypothetical protein
VPRLRTHVVDETTPRVVGSVESEYLLAHTGRGNRRWDGGELEMPQDARDHRLLGDDGNDAECAATAKGTRGHIQPKDAASQPGPRPVRGARVRLRPVQPLLARGGTDRPTQVAVWREAAPIAHEMDARQGHEGGQLLHELHWGEPNPCGAIGPGMGEGVDEIAVGLDLEAFQGDGTAGRIPYQALQLVTPVRGALGVGVQRQPLDAGTVGTGERGHLVRAAKAGANAPDPLARPLPKSHALLHGGRQGPGERGFSLHQGVIAGRHRSIATRFEVPHRAELADDPMADLLDHSGDVGVGRRLPLDKPGLAAGLGAVDVDTLKKDTMKMEIGVRRRLYLIV